MKNDDSLDLVSKSLNQRQPDPTTNNQRASKVRRISRFIKRTQYDDLARIDLERIRTDEEECIRPAFKIPASKYVDVRAVCGLKRQSFQEFAWGLVLQELARLEKRGEFVPVHKQTTL